MTSMDEFPAWQEIRALTEPGPGESRETFPGVVMWYGLRDSVLFHDAYGWALRYGEGGVSLAESERVAMAPDTIFDLASVSKLFTAIVAMQQVEAGRLELDRPVADWIGDFAAGGKTPVTVRMLLAHSSGLPAWIPLSGPDSPGPDSYGQKLARVFAEPVVHEPGTTHEYSDLNLITVGRLCEVVSGRSVQELVAEGITEPLAMSDTGYNPDPSLRQRIAAAEDQSETGRGLVWGEVHDENAWALGGVAGHAGIFSTAPDLARLARSFLADAPRPVLSPDSIAAMMANQQVPGHDHGLGFELNQPSFMGSLASARTVGHTGFTGTSLVIDLDAGAFVVLLTNRVHPTRTGPGVNQARRIAAEGLASLLV